MTDPTVTHRFQDNHAVQPGPDDGREDVREPVTTPGLAAIQQGYEEAKAGIVDAARVQVSPADDGEPLPETEKIDLRRVPLPAVRPGTREAATGAPPPRRRNWWRGVRRAWQEAASAARGEH